MKTLNFDQMERIEGGLKFAAFVCGFGIVACIAAPELIPAVGEGVVIACGAALTE